MQMIKQSCETARALLTIYARDLKEVDVVLAKFLAADLATDDHEGLIAALEAAGIHLYSPPEERGYTLFWCRQPA